MPSFKLSSLFLYGLITIEILIVIAILGILAGVLLVNIGQKPLKNSKLAILLSGLNLDNVQLINFY